MSRRSLKSTGSSGTLTAGKRKVQEKLRALDEEQDLLVTLITSFVEKAKDVGIELLQEGDRDTFFDRDLFFHRYRSVSEQLQHSIDSLYLLRTRVAEGSDEDEDSSGHEECASGAGGVAEQGEAERIGRRLGTLALGKRRIREKLRTLDEDKTFLITSFNNFVRKSKDAGTRLLQEEHRNTFFNKFKSVSKELQDCTDSLYLLRTTFIEGSDDEEDDSSDLEGGGERTPRSSSVTERSRSYTATSSPSFFSEEIQNPVHGFSSTAGSMQSLCSNQANVLDGAKSAANKGTLRAASPEIDSRHSISEKRPVEIKSERNSFSSCQEVKPYMETQSSPHSAAIKDEKCVYDCIFPEGSTIVNNVQFKPLVVFSDVPPECETENENANTSSPSHPNNSDFAACSFQQVNLMGECLTPGASTPISSESMRRSDQEPVGNDPYAISELFPSPSADRNGSVVQESKQSELSQDISFKRETESIEIPNAHLINNSVSSPQECELSLVPCDVPYISENRILHVPSSNISSHRGTAGFDAPVPQHDDLISFLQELKPWEEPCNVPNNSEKGSEPIPSSNVQYTCKSEMGSLSPSSDNVSSNSICKSESTMSLPLPESSGSLATREVESPSVPEPLTNNFHEIPKELSIEAIPKELPIATIDLIDFSSLSSKNVQAEGTCSSSRSSFYSALAPDSTEQSFSSEDGSLCEVPLFVSRKGIAVNATQNGHLSDAATIINTNQGIPQLAIEKGEDLNTDITGEQGAVGYDRGDPLIKQLTSKNVRENSNLMDNSHKIVSQEGRLSLPSQPRSSFYEDNNAAIVNYLLEVFDSASKSGDNLTEVSMTNMPVTGTENSLKSSYCSLNVMDDTEQTYYSDDDCDTVTIVDAACSLLLSKTTTSNTSTPEPEIRSEPSDITNLTDRLDVTLVEAPKSSESQQVEHLQVCRIPSPCFPTGSEILVRVLHVTSPSDFYLQLYQNDEMFVILGNALQTNKFQANRLKPPLMENMHCLTMSEDKRNWLRCKITQIASDEYVEVTLVDFGKRMTCHVSDVYEMIPDLTVFPALAVHCYLRGVEPVGPEWSGKAIDSFKCVRNSTRKAYFHNLNVDGRQAVDLSFVVKDVSFDLGMYMVTGGWAKPSSEVHSAAAHASNMASSESLSNKHMDSGFNSSSTRISSSSLVADSLCSSTSVSPMCVPTDSSTEQSSPNYQWTANVPPCQVTPDNKGQITVVLSVNVNPSEFYVNVAHELSFVLDELREEMNKFYKNCQVPSVQEDLVNVGTYWCTQYAIDKSWYRVRVEDVITAEKDGPERRSFKIQYVDYGNIEYVRSRDLKPLTTEFTAVAAFATRCCLAYIQPVDGSSWSNEAVQRFKDLTGYDKGLIGEVQEELSSSGLSLLLYDPDLTPTLNSILVQEKLAVVTQLNGHCSQSDEGVEQVVVSHQELGSMVNKLQKEHDLNEDEEYAKWDPMNLDYISVRNSYNVDIDDAGVATVGYKAKDERRICRYFSRNGRCRDGDYCHYLHIQHTLDGVTRDQVGEFIQRNEICLPSQNDVVFVQISSFFNPSHFYVILPFGTTHAANINEIMEEQYAQDGDELNELLDEMSDHYSKHSFNEDFTLVPALGSLVAVRSEKENQWFRGRVCMVDEEAEKVKVFFIDAGHKEVVHRRNVRKLQPQFCHLPSQAIECFMDIQPAHGDTWTNESRDFFKELTLGKILLAEVIMAAKTFLTIDLNCHFNGDEVNIISLLNAKKMALIPKKRVDFPFRETQDRIVYIPG